MHERQQKSRPVLAHGSGGSPVSDVTQSGVGTDALRENCNTVSACLQEELDRRFRPKHQKSLELAQVYSEMDLHSRSFRLVDCGTYLEFHLTEAGDKKLHKANFCKDRLCPMCNWRRSMKIFRQVSQVMDLLQGSGYRFLFLTLTVRNCSGEDFPATVKMLLDGWRNLYHETKVFKKVMCGTFRSLEVTINQENKTFHPHIHAILAVKPDYFHKGYVTQKQWSDMWANCCALDYDPIVYIETVKEGPKGIGGAVAEAAKYTVKDSDFLTGSDWERRKYVGALLSGLGGRRLIAMTGCFRKAKQQLGLDDAEDGDLVHVEGEELRDDLAYIIARYQWRNGCYVLSDDEYCDYSRSVEYRRRPPAEQEEGPRRGPRPRGAPVGRKV